MNDTLRAFLDKQADELDQDVQAVLATCDGDPMQALRVAIIANTFLLEENERLKAQVSAGFARRRSKNLGTK